MLVRRRDHVRPGPCGSPVAALAPVGQGTGGGGWGVATPERRVRIASLESAAVPGGPHGLGGPPGIRQR